MFWAVLTLPFASLPTRDELSGRGSRVHSLIAPAPGSHLSPALWGCASRATSPVLSLMFGCGRSVSAERRGGQPDLAVRRLATGGSPSRTRRGSLRIANAVLRRTKKNKKESL